MKELPKVLILTDPENEKNALKEAKKLGIPVVAICNSNADPTDIDYVIPANNYSIKSVYLLIGILSDAIAEGKGLPSVCEWLQPADLYGLHVGRPGVPAERPSQLSLDPCLQHRSESRVLI